MVQYKLEDLKENNSNKWNIQKLKWIMVQYKQKFKNIYHGNLKFYKNFGTKKKESYTGYIK